MPKTSPQQPPDESDKERVSNECQITVYCPPVLWQNARIFIDALKLAKKGKPGPKPPKSASALVVQLLANHLRTNGPKVGVRLPEDFLKKQ
jgi:hypothetical protein